MKNLYATVVLVSALGSSPVFAAQSVWAEVNGMVCAFCAQGIETKLRALPQTRDVYVDLPQKVVAVQMKDGTTLSTDVVREVVKDAGYEVATIKIVDKTTAQIKAEARKK